MSNWMRWGIVLVAALIAWSVARNIDGPIVHWVITILVAWLAYTWSGKMMMGT